MLPEGGVSKTEWALNFKANTGQCRGSNALRMLVIKSKVRMVPRDRIELPTRGFSVLCSTD